uniref:Protein DETOXIFICATION n=1 Tax=Daucus carota subsp. sativus TaxID=79200 RepID=A0A164ZKP1_DAUCS
MHFSFGFLLPMQRFLQSQIKVGVMAWVSLAVFLIHAVMSWIFVYQFKLGVIGIALALGIANWLIFFGLLWYVIRGGCPQTWTGLSLEAFSGIWDFFKLSAASGVMLCLENWYFRILILMTGYLKDATVAVDALSICMNVNGWEMMIPFAFFAATGVRVANELGAGNGKAAKFATVVSVCQSSMIGSLFSIILLVLHDKFALIFTTSSQVLEAVDKLSYLLAITILLNSIQPVLSVACNELICKFAIQGMWGGMIIGGTAMQTVVLVIMTLQCNWEKEAEKAVMHVQKWSSAHTNPTDEQS